jgi:hypothetical protein
VLTPEQEGWQSGGSEFTSIGSFWRARRALGPAGLRTANPNAAINISTLVSVIFLFQKFDLTTSTSSQQRDDSEEADHLALVLRFLD